jgi:hypothetical protein
VRLARKLLSESSCNDVTDSTQPEEIMKRDLNLNRFCSRLVALFFLLVLPLVWFLPSAQAAVWYVRQEALSGGDGKIGLAEAIYALQHAAELRW